MKATHKLLVILFTACATANAQVAPAATGPVGSSLQYAVRYAETAEFGLASQNSQMATASGTLNYTNGSVRAPFLAVYGGGYTWDLSGPVNQTGQFHHLYLSQAIGWRNWKVAFGNDASYLPQAPTTGFSGIPGIGEPIGITNPAPGSSQSILTLNTHVVEDNASGSLSHNLNSATLIDFSGGYGLLRYPNSDGLDTNTLSATGAIVRNFNRRNVLTGTYQYANFSYPGYTLTFETHTGLLAYRHFWTRNLSTSVGAGPQWLMSTVSTVVPNSTNVVANADVLYVLRSTSFGANYSRGTNGGGGYLFGGQVDTFTGNFSRQFGINFTVGLTGGFQRTAGLNNNGTTDGVFGGAQATWRIARRMIAFANYTGIEQTSTSALPTNTLNVPTQTISFGFGYSPLPKRVRQ